MSEASYSEFDAARMIEEAASSPSSLPRGCERLLRLAHQASLSPDEGRHPRFVAALSDPSSRRAPVQPFETPWLVEQRPDVLSRLSFATAPEWSCLEVSEDARSRLCAWGISPVPEAQDDTDASSEAVALVEVMDPGCVRLETERAIAAHQRGRWLSARTAARLTDALPDGAVEALASTMTGLDDAGDLRVGSATMRLDAAAWERQASHVRGEARAVARPFLARALRGLVRAVRRRGHGGSLLLLRDGLSLHEAASGGALRARGAFGDAGARAFNSALLDQACWYLHWSLALEGRAVLAELAPMPDAARERTCRARMHSARRLLDADLERTAQLTQVDGAVACSALLTPQAMGVMLRVAPTAAPPAALTRGARHASLESAARALPGCVGIAVSHDGETTLLKASGDDVLRLDVLL